MLNRDEGQHTRNLEFGVFRSRFFETQKATVREAPDS
jgi:hypothetical protein